MRLVVGGRCFVEAGNRPAFVSGGQQLAILLLILARPRDDHSPISLQSDLIDLGWLDPDDRSLFRSLTALAEKGALVKSDDGPPPLYRLNPALVASGTPRLLRDKLVEGRQAKPTPEANAELERISRRAGDFLAGGPREEVAPAPASDAPAPVDPLAEFLEVCPAWGMDLIGQTATLSDLYVPPRVVALTEDEVMGLVAHVPATTLLRRVDPGAHPAGIDSFLEAWAGSDHRLLLLLGDAGYGKSTSLRFFALHQRRAGRRCTFVKLNTLHSDDALIGQSAILDQIKRTDSRALEPGAILVLDGLDEFIGLYPLHGILILRIGKSLAQQGVHVVLSGRPSAFVLPEFRAEIGHWQAVGLLPFCLLRRRTDRIDDPHLFHSQAHYGESWWKKFGAVTGLGTGEIPAPIRPQGFLYTPAAHLSCEPLTTVQAAVALNGTEAVPDASFGSWQVYDRVLRAIWRKEYEQEARSSKSERLFRAFVRTLEVVALASWGAGGRSASLDRIEEFGRRLGRGDAVAGLVQRGRERDDSVLLLFYLQRSYGETSETDAIEFVHKGFGDYLVARFLIENSRAILSGGAELRPIVASGAITEEIARLVDEGVRAEVEDDEAVGRANVGLRRTVVARFREELFGALLASDRTGAFDAEDGDVPPALGDHYSIEQRAYLLERNVAILGNAYRRHAFEAGRGVVRQVLSVRLVRDGLPYDPDRGALLRALSYSLVRQADIVALAAPIVNELFEGDSLREVSLHGADFTRASLFCSLSNAYFRECAFDGAELRAGLQGACFVGCVFRDALFERCDFEGATFDRCTFAGCRLSGGPISSARLADCDFAGSTFDAGAGRFADCDLRDSSLSGARFEAPPRFAECRAAAALLDQEFTVVGEPRTLRGFGWTIDEKGILRYEPSP